jgi:signal transduction histidine kinase
VTDRSAYATLDLVPEAVLVLDADHHVVHMNDRARVLLGVTDESLGEPVAKVLDLRDDGGNACDDSWLPRPGVPQRIAERVTRVALPDGRLRPIAVAGRLVGDLTILTFRSAGRRERVDAARSDLVATVSHEIRSPLTSVKGFTSTMLRKWERFSDEQKRAMLETINHDADRVTRLLKELLAVSRIDAGRLQLHRELLDVTEILEGLVDRTRHHEENAHRDVALDVNGALPRLLADPDKVEQVFSNLLENALKYAPESQIRIWAEHEDGHVHVTVADDGPGIPRDQTRRIFEKFGRGREQRRSGTGLGLYITRGLVVAHGGQVWCDSEEGQGATFHVLLPAATPPA